MFMEEKKKTLQESLQKLVQLSKLTWIPNENKLLQEALFRVDLIDTKTNQVLEKSLDDIITDFAVFLETCIEKRRSDTVFLHEHSQHSNYELRFEVEDNFDYTMEILEYIDALETMIKPLYNEWKYVENKKKRSKVQHIYEGLI